MPLISIITVTYNAAEVIDSTLRSVAEQSFCDYEHIIVDGASNDATLSIAAGGNFRNLIIHSAPDTGIYHGMNRGLKYAQGKYILFLNAGDRFASVDTLSYYAQASQKDSDIIYGDTLIVDKKGKILRPRHLDSPHILTYKSFLQGMLICHQAFMVRKAIAPQFNLEFRLSSDYDWCLECIAKSRITHRYNLKSVTIHYLEGGLSQKKKLESLKERFVIMRRRFGLYRTLKAHISFIARAVFRHTK